ncbi:hypothetical protein IEQ34_018291 [Dendrobium chrysotoxum]|uniref:Uncharacterized protein n=1 Tax=Dendrobium chrysotoxum TaxID=161865 RepID=A0AAV7GDV3_DENCH|nr:hypothetical protein IEQ34_018291 [Dendrobium chrysotoxum]
MTLPVLTRMKKVLNTSPAEISPFSANFPPYQKSNAQERNDRHGEQSITIPVVQALFTAALFGSSCAF